MTDLSLSLSLSEQNFSGGKKEKKKKKNAMTTREEDDLYRALGIERTASQEEIRKAYKTTGTLAKALCAVWKKIFSSFRFVSSVGPTKVTMMSFSQFGNGGVPRCPERARARRTTTTRHHHAR